MALTQPFSFNASDAFFGQAEKIATALQPYALSIALLLAFAAATLSAVKILLSGNARSLGDLAGTAFWAGLATLLITMHGDIFGAFREIEVQALQALGLSDHGIWTAVTVFWDGFLTFGKYLGSVVTNGTGYDFDKGVQNQDGLTYIKSVAAGIASLAFPMTVLLAVIFNILSHLIVVISCFVAMIALAVSAIYVMIWAIFGDFMLAIGLATSVLFIAGAATDATRSYFTAWINFCISAVLFKVVPLIIMKLTTGVFEEARKYSKYIAVGNHEISWDSVAERGFVMSFFALAMIVLLKNTPMIVAGLMSGRAYMHFGSIPGLSTGNGSNNNGSSKPTQGQPSSSQKGGGIGKAVSGTLSSAGARSSTIGAGLSGRSGMSGAVHGVTGMAYKAAGTALTAASGGVGSAQALSSTARAARNMVAAGYLVSARVAPGTPSAPQATTQTTSRTP